MFTRVAVASAASGVSSVNPPVPVAVKSQSLGEAVPPSSLVTVLTSFRVAPPVIVTPEIPVCSP